MKDNHDIKQIRSLLDSYYRAETSPEEEETLEWFFSEVSFDDLPEDLVSSKRLFDITRQSHPTIEDSEVPADLFGKLNGILEKPLSTNSGKRSRNIHYILRYSEAVAAACVAIAIMMVFMRTADKEVPEDQVITAEVVSSKEEKPGIPVLIEPAETEKVVPSIEQRASKESSKVEAKPSVEEQPDEEEDGFIEITDPAEAQKIMLEIGKLLAKNAAETNIAMCDIANSIDNYKEISKSILR